MREERVYCPCGCGLSGVEGRRDHFERLRMIEYATNCKHERAVPTLAHGVSYCNRCDHWLGTREAFARLRPEPPPFDRERRIYTDAAGCSALEEAKGE